MRTMPLQRDLREFIESLNSHHVEYVIVGAFALAFHGVPRSDQGIQPGHPPNRIDLLTSITGVEFDEARAGRVAASLHGIPFHFLKATGRTRDLADLEALGAR